MRRIRWYDPDSNIPSTPIDWRVAALMTATLFLNIHFWQAHGDDLWMGYPILAFAGIAALTAWLITALFFFAPACAAQELKRPLLSALENSVGSIPALVLRLCCVVFLVLWIASVLAVPALWWVEVVFWRGVSSTVVQLIAVGIAALVFVTGLQSARTVGRLALFTNKLGIALLLAALIRVHGGFPAALNGFGHGGRSAIELWQGLSRLVFYAGPLALLASNFGYRSQSRRQATMIGLGGFVLPIFGTLMLTGLINIATLDSSRLPAELEPDGRHGSVGPRCEQCVAAPDDVCCDHGVRRDAIRGEIAG